MAGIRHSRERKFVECICGRTLHSAEMEIANEKRLYGML